MRSMNALLEKIHQAQVSHYARVEGLLSTLVHNSVDLQTQQVCQKVQQAYNRSQAPSVPRFLPVSEKTNTNSSDYFSYGLQFNLAPPDASWDNVFLLPEQNGTSPI